jgi:hypothetical protein
MQNQEKTTIEDEEIPKIKDRKSNIKIDIGTHSNKTYEINNTEIEKIWKEK